ncbi:hypothetical protein [Halotia branconii]|uniref:Uncharacterized protein n=1 Tax=Halotia branconii CENA392 TaxID=1539056 RepID=A0AAJ6NTG5_9CYAN|nr:hypothetical protein [Halotia branconii]WGV26297.1 hypothetical protein QI031_01930 [Halotia branconii CENA392]
MELLTTILVWLGAIILLTGFIFITGFERSQLVNMVNWSTRPLWKRIVGRVVLFLQLQL